MLKIRAIISKSLHYFGLVQLYNIIIFSNRFFQKTPQDKLFNLNHSCEVNANVVEVLFGFLFVVFLGVFRVF